MILNAFIDGHFQIYTFIQKKLIVYRKRYFKTKLNSMYYIGGGILRDYTANEPQWLILISYTSLFHIFNGKSIFHICYRLVCYQIVYEFVQIVVIVIKYWPQIFISNTVCLEHFNVAKDKSELKTNNFTN